MSGGQIFSLIMVVAFIFGAFYLRSYILKRVTGQNWSSRFGNRNIVVLESFAIARDKSFNLIKVKDKIYFVAVTNESATLIDTLDATAFLEAEDDDASEQPGSEKSKINKRMANLMTSDSVYARMTRGLAGFFTKKMGKSDDFAEALKQAEQTKIEEEKE